MVNCQDSKTSIWGVLILCDQVFIWIACGFSCGNLAGFLRDPGVTTSLAVSLAGTLREPCGILAWRRTDMNARETHSTGVYWHPSFELSTSAWEMKPRKHSRATDARTLLDATSLADAPCRKTWAWRIPSASYGPKICTLETPVLTSTKAYPKP